MTYDKSWSFLLNQAPTDSSNSVQLCRSFLYQLKTLLVATVGWSVVSSSNGTTYSATDLWSGLSALNWGVSGAARSWILLKSPVGLCAGPSGSYTGSQSQLYLCIECLEPLSGNENYIDFTLYITPTGGSTTVPPSGGIGLSGSSYPIFINSSSLTQRFHYAYTPEGGFYAANSINGSNTVSALVFVLPLVDLGKYGAIDYPYAVLMGLANKDYPGSVWDMNVVFDKLGNSYCGVFLFSHDGTQGNPRCVYLQSNTGVVISPGTNTAAGGDINGNILTYNGYIYNNQAGARAYVGKIPDILGTGATIGNGSTIPSSGTPSHCAVNQLFIPADAALLL